MGPRMRLALLAAALVGGLTAFWVLDLVSERQVRDWADGFGPFAAPAYVLLAAALGAALVPGPLLAGASGLLFGPALGSVVTLSASVLGAVLALRLGRAGGAAALAHGRAGRAGDLARRHGLVAVIVQRLTPGVPDAPLSYAFGALRVRTWQIALGTAIGAAPRAFAYTAIGSSLDDPGSPLALAAIATLVLTAVAGAELARRAAVRARA